MARIQKTIRTILWFIGRFQFENTLFRNFSQKIIYRLSIKNLLKNYYIGWIPKIFMQFIYRLNAENFHKNSCIDLLNDFNSKIHFFGQKIYFIIQTSFLTLFWTFLMLENSLVDNMCHFVSYLKHFWVFCW